MLKIIFLIVLFALPVQAEPISTLNIEDALQIAMSNNPEFKSKTLNTDIREADIKTAGARPNPALITDAGTAEDTYRVGLSYNVELGGKRRKRIKVSETNLAIEKEVFNAEKLRFRTEVRQGYSQLYYSRKRLSILEKVRENSDKLLKIAQKREKAGAIPHLEVLQVELARANAENQYEKALYQIKESHHQLEFLLNSELAENISLSPPNLLPHLPADISVDNVQGEVLTASAIKNRSDLKIGDLNQKLAKEELALTKSKRSPDLLLSGGPDFVTGDNSGAGAFLMAQIGLPIFNRMHGEIKAGKIRQSQLALEQEAITNRLKAEVDHAYLAYIANRAILDRFEKELLPKAEDILTKSYRSFELGKSSILVSLKSQSDYMDSQINYIQTLVDYQESINLLEKAIGVEI